MTTRLSLGMPACYPHRPRVSSPIGVLCPRKPARKPAQEARRHLANANKLHHIRVVNFELGLPCPVLTTPLNFLSGGHNNE